jgi:hypothetical protein
MKGKHLDEQIRKALENLEVNFDPGSWSAFEERLDAASTDATDPLDKLVTDRLADFEVPLQAGDWDKMEQLIEAEETAELLENEAYIDNLAYEKLHRMEVPLQHSHWHLMAKRLEEEFSLRHKLYRYKVAEVALMALFLLTVIRYLPFAESLMQREPKANETKQLKNSPAPVQLPAFDPQQILPQTAPVNPASQSLPATPIASAASPENQQTPAVKNFKKTSKAPAGTDAAWTENTNLGFGSVAGNISKIPFANASGVNSLTGPLSIADMLKERNFINNNLKTPGLRAAQSNAELLASLQPGPVQSKYAWEMPQLPQNVFEKESEIRFSLFTATDFSYVFTPSNKLSVFDTLVPTDPDTTLASGYGGGILISWKKDRWEFQTGGVYSFKRYIPNTPVFLFETVNYYVREEFHGVQLDLLQVPLNLQYHLKNTGKWRFYGSGGISGHFITSSVYEITHQRTPAFKLAAAPPPEGDLLEDNSTIRNEKEFPKGLFDGGKLRSNLYLTANFGFGVERFVSPKWSLFFQPNYQHYLMTEGIGTNKDKFYTLSFNLGTKVTLK